MLSRSLASSPRTRSCAPFAIAGLLLGICSHSGPMQAAVYEWTGTAGDSFWSNPANWVPDGVPGPGDDARLFDRGAASDDLTPTVRISTDTVLQSLWIGQTNGHHRLELQNGATLTLEGTTAQNVLVVGTETDNGNAQTVAAAVGGTGARLMVTNPSGTVAVRQSSANSGSALRATLDLSGLQEVTLDVGRLLVGSESPVAPRPSGILWLGATNRIHLSGAAPALAIGGRGGNNNGGNSSYLYLGAVNEIFADSIMVGRGKQGGDSSILFQTNLFAAPSAVFRAADGQSRVGYWSVADSEGISGTVNTRGSCQFLGGWVDALVDTLFIARSSTGSGSGTPAGYFVMDRGTLDVNRLYVGYQSQPGNNAARGTLHLVGPGLIRVNEWLELAHVSGGAGAAQVEGTLNITQGRVEVLGAFVSGGGRITVTVTNGSLTLPENAELHADTLILDGGRLTNLAVLAVSNQCLALNGSRLEGVQSCDLGNTGLAYWDLSGLENPLTLAGGLTGSGTLIGEVALQPGAVLDPAGTGQAGYLTLSHPLTLDRAVLAFDLAASAMGLNDLIQTFDQLRLRGKQLVRLNALEGTFDTTTAYTLFTATQVAQENASFEVVGPLARSRYTFHFDTSQPGAVRLIVSGDPPRSLTWVGDGIANRWNVQGDANWNNGLGADRFYNLDSVLFDDTGNAQAPIRLEGALVPGTFTLAAATRTYVFTGAGAWEGGQLIVNGPAVTRIENSGTNRFDSLTLNSGTLIFAGDNLNAIGGSMLAIAPGSTLVLSNTGPNELPAAVGLEGTLVWAPTGEATFNGTLTGMGKLVKDGPGQLTLSGDNTGLVGTEPVEIRNGILQVTSLDSLPVAGAVVHPGGTLDVNGVNLQDRPIVLAGWGANDQGALVNNNGNPNYVSPNVRDVTLTADTAVGGTGRLDIRSPGGSSGDPATARLSTGGQPFNLHKVGPNGVYIVSVTFDPALADIEIHQGLLAFEGTTTSMGDPNRTLTVHPGATLQFYRTTNAWNKQFVFHGSGTNITVNNASWTNRLVGPITLHGPCWFNAGGNLLIVDSPISGEGDLIKQGGSTLRLGGVSTHTGETVVSNGTFQLEGRLEQTRRMLVAGGTLSGRGTILAPLEVLPGGTVAPAGTDRGTLTVNGVVTLNGTAEFDVFRSDTGSIDSDRLQGATEIRFGGILRLNLSGQPLAEGDVLTLFDAATYTGRFDAIEPPVPGPDLAWDASRLAVDGTLRVGPPAPAQPTIEQVQLTGAELRLLGSGGVPGAAYTVRASTNLMLPAAQWWPVLTNNFDPSGRFELTLPVDPALSPLFYRLSIP